MAFLQTLAYVLTIEPRRLRLQRLLPNARIEPAGSRYVCNPPVMDTDIDFLVYCTDADLDKLVICGYTETKKQYGPVGKPIRCFRKGSVNLITTCSQKYFETFDTGTHLCKRFNVRDKVLRIAIREGLRGGLPAGYKFEELGWHNRELQEIVCNLTSAHGPAMIKTYRIQHGLD